MLDRASTSIGSSCTHVSKELTSVEKELQNGTGVKARTILRTSRGTLMKGHKATRRCLPLLENTRAAQHFGVLKNAVGKNSLNFALPVALNEPFSLVQR